MNNFMPKVSIIIPVYNAEKYIESCLESVVSQTYPNIEILLMVGQCNDSSLEKCIKWQKKNSKIIIVSRKDNSLGDARNYGLKIAQGDFVAYVDADDYVENNFIYKLLKPFLTDDLLDFVCCGFDKFRENEMLKEGWVPEERGKKEVSFTSYVNCIKYGVVWNKMYRTKWLVEKNITMFDGCHEDDAMHFILASQVKHVYLISEALYHYNVGNVVSLLHNKKNRLQYFDAVRFVIDYYKQNNILEMYYYQIRKIVLNSVKFILEETQEDIEIITKYEDFLAEIYPEVHDEFSFWKCRNIQLESTLIIFGGGADCNLLLKQIDKEKIRYIVDNNVQLHGKMVENIPVVSFAELLNYRDSYTVIVSSSHYFYEIARQLRQNGIYNYVSPEDYYIKKFEKRRKDKNLVLFNTPEHSNIGDHTIAEAEKGFFGKYFSDYGLIEITDMMYKRYGKKLKRIISREDIIIITGGGFLGSLWMDGGEQAVRRIMEEYSENKIIIFPQTIYFEDNTYGKYELEISKQIYRKCRNLTVFLREMKSYNTARQMLDGYAKCELFPDIVLSMSGLDAENGNRAGAALCLKECKESLLSSEQKKYIEQHLKNNFKVEKITMHSAGEIYPNMRNYYIQEKIEEIKKYELVVTDALHCMLFCAISGTRCIALNNISGKVEGVYQWIKSLSYIRFASSEKEIDKLSTELLQIVDTRYTFDFNIYVDKIIDAIKETI
ncbi:hypothetical protein acsn021_05260 [Anaerocolumna cellulosilytica]|uniref:Uncharacterized protein n=1 Tax=Anaerocolumna cellulosilytica TaxID=433286 RepID=A0A6S6QYK1_9FIRM|nr:glycosyltransferase [Anaerocolumna cellulosilytica]MBB5195707.1 exopolysaccharide biosynthesis predicted pyruvyl transferase EpsI [Anaerocolumna cellulosilytica]BCJ92957.1 hypothetical protein acsn021_05260 [Anaerocolumna cellulosilytica]